MHLTHTCSLVGWLGLAILTQGCDDPTGSLIPGAITVEVDEEGTDAPRRGYRSAVDNGPWQALDVPSLRTRFKSVEPGERTVRLEGLAPNCEIVGQNPLVVQVVGNEIAIARFNVACVANVGTLRVTTVTTGDDLDPNGYEGVVDGVRHATIGLNATAAISGVRAGMQLISLGDVAPNCAVAAPHPVAVNVAFQGTVDVVFAIQCVVSGALRVTVTTTGVAINPNGYVITVQAPQLGFASTRTVGANGSVTFTGLRPAPDYQVALQALAANCDVVGADVQTAGVTGGSTTTAAFEVACLPVPQLAFVRDEDIYLKAVSSPLTRLTSEPGVDGDPAWSSAGRIAFTTRRHGNAELYVMDADGTNPVRVTTSAGDDAMPTWSPSGDRIAFHSARDVSLEIYVVNADGTGATRLTNNAAADYQPAWSSTGRIAFISTRDHPAGEIYVMDEDGSNVVRLTNNTATESGPAWSPDGSMIAFSRAIDCIYYYYEYSCGQALLVMNADGSGERTLPTGDGTSLENMDPSWSPNGDAIAFTQTACSFFCPPSVLIVDLHGTAPTVFASNAANPAWKP